MGRGRGECLHACIGECMRTWLAQVTAQSEKSDHAHGTQRSMMYMACTLSAMEIFACTSRAQSSSTTVLAELPSLRHLRGAAAGSGALSALSDFFERTCHVQLYLIRSPRAALFTHLSPIRPLHSSRASRELQSPTQLSSRYHAGRRAFRCSIGSSLVPPSHPDMWSFTHPTNSPRCLHPPLHVRRRQSRCHVHAFGLPFPAR